MKKQNAQLDQQQMDRFDLTSHWKSTGVFPTRNSLRPEQFRNRVHLSVIDNSWVPQETVKTDDTEAHLLPSNLQSNKDQLKAPQLPEALPRPWPQPFSSLVLDTAALQLFRPKSSHSSLIPCPLITTFSLIIKFKTQSLTTSHQFHASPGHLGQTETSGFGLLCPPFSFCSQHSFQLDSLRK